MIPSADPQTLRLAADLDALGLRSQATADALMATETSAELLKRWPAISRGLLAVRDRSVADATVVTGQYLLTYGRRLPDGYRPGLGSFNWKRQLARVPGDAGRRIAGGQSADDVAGILRREWRGRALGEAHRASRTVVARNTGRFVRIPEPGACEFCMMLATRSGQYAYLSRESAGEGLAYHNRCRCTVQPE